MKPSLKLACVALPMLLSACADNTVRDTLGLTREAPDEFSVVSRPPLSIPPEFSLRPPKPGEPPRGTPTDEQARELITGKPTPKDTDPSKLEQPKVESAVTPVARGELLTGGGEALLKKAGAQGADSEIRDKLNVDAATPRENSDAKTLIDQLAGKEKNEPTVDAKKEAARLRANKDEKKPLNEGEVPEEAQHNKSLMDRIF